MSNPYILTINNTDKNRWNCVLFARSLVKSLPFGLWNIKDKRKIINTHKPQHGDIAIINVGMPWGHVAYVEKVGKWHITITEANFKFGKITERHDTEKNLKILGYYQP